MDAESGIRECRFCHGTSFSRKRPMIAPCRCSGSMKFVHRDCLDHWRAASPNPEHFYSCEVCKFRFRLHDRGVAVRRVARAKFGFFVALDFFGVLLALNLLIVLLGMLLMAIWPSIDRQLDQYAPSFHLVDHSWNKTAIQVANYYEFGGILLLFLIGLVGSFIAIYKKCFSSTDEDGDRRSSAPVTGSSYPHNAACGDCYFVYCAWPHSDYHYMNHHHHAHTELRPCTCNCGSRDCDGCAGDCTDIALCHSCESGGSGSSCGGCGAGGSGCSGSGDCGDLGEGAVVLAILALIVIAIFVILGIFFGVIAATALGTKIIQRHVHVLYRAKEATVFEVVDLDGVDLSSEGNWAGGNAAASAPVLLGNEYAEMSGDVRQPLLTNGGTYPKGKSMLDE